MSALRARRRSLSLSDAASLEEVEGLAAEPGPDPCDPELRRRIESLPEKQRQAVTLYYFDERPVEEVADMMGLPPNTVKTHLHRARATRRVVRRRGGGSRMNRRDDDFDLRMRRHFAGIDTSPEFAARLAERIAARTAEPAAERRARIERQREALRQGLRREAWTSAAAAASIGAAAIATLWRHGPAVEGKVEALLALPAEPDLLGGIATAVLAASLWPVLQRYMPR